MASGEAAATATTTTATTAATTTTTLLPKPVLPRNIAASLEHQASGAASVRAGRFGEALYHFTMAIRADALNPGLRLARAEAFMRLSQFPQAEGDCMTALVAVRFYEHSLDLPNIFERLAECALQTSNVAVSKRALDGLEFLGEKARYEKHTAAFKAHWQTMNDAYAKAKASPDPRHDAHMNEMLARQAMHAAVHVRAPSISLASTMLRAFPGGPRHPDVALPQIKQMFADCSAVEVRYGAKGFGVFATRAIKTGEVLLREIPVVNAPVKPDAQCEFCLRALRAKPVTCAPGCTALFCSAKCRDRATEEYHGPLCGMDWRDVMSQAAKGKTASADHGVLATKLFGMALAQAYKQGSPTMLCAPADLPAVKLLWRATDVAAQELGDIRPLHWFHAFHKAALDCAESNGARSLAAYRLLLDPTLDVNAFAAVGYVLYANEIGYGGLRETGGALRNLSGQRL